MIQNRGLLFSCLVASFSFVIGYGNVPAEGGSAQDSDSKNSIDTDKPVETYSYINTDSDTFSFFVISLEKIQEWGGPEGLGGNLGGLSGADAKCQEAAEAVGSTRRWHAFLSVTDDGSGNPVNAIDRIGSGPWYNVDGLLVANNIDGLLNGKNNGMRPDAASDIVYNDGNENWPFYECLTTEFGNCNLSYGDSHDTLTGSNMQGQLVSCNDVGSSSSGKGGSSCNASSYELTCNDWTSTSYSGKLPIGHSWNRRIGSTKQNSAHWIHAHECTGCGTNINLSKSFEDGVGGSGGYGAWYCFAYD
jgi:hypothetical protein